MKPFFPRVDFLIGLILWIVVSPIETERIFSLTKIFTNLRRCHLQVENLETLVFVRKNWSNDFRIDSKPPFNLLELIEEDLNFEKLKEFEGSFE
jgi:hypothetical protein